ncbi:MAG: N-acetylneuraminate synthase family protein [Verrucomicrobia bacterium]|nr:N-acetylneuraminate synthase family protein [Verrucomicrobiota bacterium]
MSELFKDLFIFEMANNHQGSVEHGLKIVWEMGAIAKRRGVRAAVKLQYRDLDTFIHPDYKGRKDVKHIPRFLSTRLTDGEFDKLVEAIRAEGMLTMVTPFDEPSVARCVEQKIDLLKVASCSATDWPLLEQMVQAGRPMIVSTGGVGLSEIDNIVSYLSHKKVSLALMHCVGLYPAPNSALHLNFIRKLISRYGNVPVGYSGHEAPDNLDVVKVAVSKGASLLERHVGIALDTVPLNSYSSSPEQVDAWVASALVAREICGDVESKQVGQQETNSLLSLKRGVYARRKIKQGSVISRDDVFFAMPCGEGQTTSGEFGRYRTTYVASRDYPQNAPIAETCQLDSIHKVRSIVHDAKGMLFEAKIVLGNDVEIELSHHDGIEQFRQTGAIIVSVVNRNYCKKLIIMFPGQKHPAHAHRVKEETFQLLWGDLEVDVDGAVAHMQPGDKALVEPGQMHSFRSCHGAIFEEISSTHRRDDSFYADERINRMDPLERKTILTDW